MLNNLFENLSNQFSIARRIINDVQDSELFNSVRNRVDDLLSGTIGNIRLGFGNNDSFGGVANGRTFNGTPGNDNFNIVGDRNTINSNAGTNSFFVGGSSNRITGGAGIDRFTITGNNNILNGEGGTDRLTVAGNGNRLNGGDGADILDVAGQRNQINGNAGNDILLGRGNNTLNGGAGNDRFLLAPFNVGRGVNSQTPGQSLIQDFQDGVDQIVLPTAIFINLNGTPMQRRVLRFDELTISQQAQGVGISYQGRSLAVFQGAQASQITATDFASPTATESRLVAGFGGVRLPVAI